MSWHFLERWVEKANQHSTLIGKFWITFLVVCRMVIVATVGDRVYTDEQSEFKCNTLQLGCTNVCFNDFSPISHLRFWSFEILFVATPSVMFVIYSAHKAKVKKASERKKPRLSSDDDDKAASEKNQLLTKSAGTRGNSRCDKRKRSNVEKFNEENEKTDRFPTRQSKTSIISMDKYQQWRKVNAPWIESDPIFPKSTLITLKGSHDYVNQLEQDYFDNDIKLKAKSSPREIASPVLVNRNLWRNNYYAADNLNNNNNSTREHPFVWKKPSRKFNQESANATREISNLISWLPQQREPLLGSQPNHPSSNERMRETEYKLLSNMTAREFNESQASPLAQFPSAPPGYPGLDENPNQMQNGEAWGAMPRQISSSLSVQKKRKASERKDKEPASQEVKPAAAILMAEHFRWYVANVFARLCMEIGFAFLQLKLFGLYVPELYKCQRWPCPNVVDCFISRPTEKTIFLWFMFIYSCICVALNVVEIFYLFYAYISEKLTARRLRRKRLKKKRLLQHKASEKKANGGNGFLPNDKRHQMVMLEESLSSWSNKLIHGGAKHCRYSREGNAAENSFNCNDQKDFGSQDFIAILLDSDQCNSQDEMDMARAEEDDINEMDDFNALNYDMDMTMGADNDDGGVEQGPV